MRKITKLPVLLVFAGFALSLLLVLLTGARVCQSLSEQTREQYTQRTAAQYIATRVRQAEAVRVEEFDGGQALVLYETIEGDTYVTRVYCHQGWLMELFCAESARLHRPDGEKLLKTGEITFRLEGSLLTAEHSGRVQQLHLPGKAVAP